MDVKYIKRKRGTVLLFDGRQYYKLRTYKNGSTIWTCRNLRKEKCRGSITLKDDNIVKSSDHTCLADHYKNEVDLALADLRQNVTTTDALILDVYHEMRQSLSKSDANVEKIPTFINIKSGLYKKRGKTCFVNVAEVTIPDKFEYFLLADYNVEKCRIIVFCSKRNQEKMVQSEEFFGDGTFYSCPFPFAQLYCIHADLTQSLASTNIVPALYALMTHKTMESYLILFSLIKSQLKNWAPKTFHMDFETAASKALTKSFPTIKIIKCFYHFTNSQWRRAKTLKIKNKDERRVVGLCAALALLPDDRIEEGFDFINSDNNPKTTKTLTYLDYFKTTWMQNKYSQWSVFGQRHRTDNVVEAWNRQLNKSMKRHNPITLARLLETIIKLENSTLDVPSPRPRRQEHINRDEYIRKCQTELINNEISVGYFLNKLR